MYQLIKKINQIKFHKKLLFIAGAELVLFVSAGLVGYLSVNKMQKRRQERLKNIINNTLSSDNLDEAVRNITSELGKLFNADRVHFRLYDSNINTFSEVIEENRKNENISSAKGKMIYPKDFNEFLRTKLYETKSIYVIKDIHDPKYPESFKKLFESLGIKNQIVLPIFYKDKLESAFFISNTKSYEQLSKENLNFLLPIAKQISVGTHLFKVNNALNITLKNEKILRDMFMEVSKFIEPEDVFSYLVNRLTSVYSLDRVLHMQPDENNNLSVINEAINSENLEKLQGREMFYERDYEELTKNTEGNIIAVNDINQIQSEGIRDNLERNEIRAFLLYPLEEIVPRLKEENVRDRIMVCSQAPKKWSQEEINALKTIVGTIAVIYIEIRDRKKLEELKRTYIATLTHDLRSPIYGEQKALEFILSRGNDVQLKEFREYLNDIYNTNDELLRIVNNILIVHQIDSGRLNLNLEPADIRELADKAVKSIKYLAQEQETKIDINIEEGLPEVRADKDQIQRVLVNLLSNAIKHNRKGIEINISAHKQENEVQVSVNDNGQGILEYERENIFQKFPTTKRKIGTGLGLYLSKQIIGAHHGKIWFTTEENKGTTFFFTLPAAK